MPAPPLIMQTIYAELLERGATTAFNEAFPQEGAFTSKAIKGRRYWYFQAQSPQGRTQKYVGPETPELLERIAHHKQARDDERERRSLVSTLVRSFGLPRPIPQMGDVIHALAKAGVFRLQGVLVGTMAYQTYSAMLGTRLPQATLQTIDIDVAQFTNVSVAVNDRTRPVLEILRQVDKTFREVPSVHDNRLVVSYAGKGAVRVDFLTPNEGPDTDAPQALPALQTHAQPLRFLDFLIHDSEAAVILHGAGVQVRVPAPERYAVHKLIVSRRRPEVAKRDKDLQQAAALFEALAQKRPHELKSAWEEAIQRGQKWRQLLLEGMSQVAPDSRDLALKILNSTRDSLPGVNLTFNNPPAIYDFHRDVVKFSGSTLGDAVACAISREALEDHFGADNVDRNGRVEIFQKNRSRIEQMVRIKYLSWPVEEPGAILIRTEDVKKLLGVMSEK